MKTIFLCCVYLCIAVGTVRSATYYYRAGREIIVPRIEETIKEVVPDLQKDTLVVLEEVLVQNPKENVVSAKSALPVVDEQLVISENNIIPEIKEVVTIVSDEARAKPNPALKFETLEIAQPVGSGINVATVAETVKNAAIEAIRKENAESIELKNPVATAEPVAVVQNAPIVDPVVVKIADVADSNVLKSTPLENTAPIVSDPVAVESSAIIEPVAVKITEVVEPIAVKSIPAENPTLVAEPVAIVKEQNAVVDAKVPIVDVVKIEESLRTADAEAPTPDAVQEVVKDDETKEPKEEVDEADRQTQPAPPTNLLTQFTNLVQGIPNPFQSSSSNSPNPLGQILSIFTGRPSSDAPAVAPVQSDSVTGEAAATPASSTPATGPAAILQTLQNSIAGVFQRTSTTIAPAPSDATVSATSESRDGEENVQIVQNIAEVVDDKVDLTE